MNVTCPHCGARYLLPSNLLGPGGARVRCPSCSRSFDVAPPAAPPAAGGEVPAEVPPPATRAAGPRETPRRPAAGAGEVAATATTAEVVARQLLGALSSENGDALSAAAAQGNLFARHGPAIFAAYDEYRRRAPAAGAGPFRAVMREMWGVELPEVTPRP
jgi:predicted Zn finger-like uncharacterized protein